MTEWTSTVVFVPEKDQSLRFSVDYRRLNVVTVQDIYSVPRMDEYNDSQGKAQMSSTLVATSGYWQI